MTDTASILNQGMRFFCLLLSLLALAQARVPTAHADETIRFDFTSLEQWEALSLPGVDKASTYSIATDESGETILETKSSASASGLISRSSFDPHRLPRLCWKWKIKNVYKNGNALQKSGDDYPLRIFVVFPYDAASVSLLEKARYESAKLLYGQYPPGRSLNYIWANRQHKESRMRSTYTEMAELIIVESGNKNARRWMTEEVDILADYQRAFGKPAPHTARLAIMNDSDNTGESSTSHIEYIELAQESAETSCSSSR